MNERTNELMNVYYRMKKIQQKSKATKKTTGKTEPEEETGFQLPPPPAPPDPPSGKKPKRKCKEGEKSRKSKSGVEDESKDGVRPKSTEDGKAAVTSVMCREKTEKVDDDQTRSRTSASRCGQKNSEQCAEWLK